MPQGFNLKIRSTYGKPWSKMAGKIELSREDLHLLGETLVECIVAEARKDLAKQGQSPTPRGQPEGLPTSESFFDSFSYQIRGESTVEVSSTWPWIEQHIEGRDSFVMKWLTRDNGVHHVPMVQADGTVLVRTAPLTVQDAWIHPGYARHTFLARGVRKAREMAAEIIKERVIEMLKQGTPG